MPRGKRKVIEAEQPGTSPEAQAEQPDTSPEAQAEQPDTSPEAQAEQPDTSPEAQAEQPDTSPEAQAEQPDTSPEAQAEQEPDEKDFVIKVKRGQALVQAAITDLHHPFEGVWITTANPVVVKRDSWLESQIAAKLIKVLK